MDNLDKKLESISTYLREIVDEVYHATEITCYDIEENNYKRAVNIVKEKLKDITLTPQDLNKFIEEAGGFSTLSSPSSKLYPSFIIVVTGSINKISADNPGKVIELIDFYNSYAYLLAGVENAKVKGIRAGDYLAYGAKNSQILFKKAGNEPGTYMINSILILEEAGDDVGKNAYGSEIYIKGEAGKYVGNGILNSYIVANVVGKFLATDSVNTKVVVNIVNGDGAGYNMIRGELNANVILGDCFGCHSKYSILRASTIKGRSIGRDAKGVTIYVYKIINPSNKPISLDFFKDSRNVLYVGKTTYEQLKKIPEYNEPIKRGNIGVWEEEDYRKWYSDLEKKLDKLETIDIS